MRRVVLVNPGLKPGGMTVDLENLAIGLRQRAVDVACAGTLREARSQMHREPETLLHVFGCLPSVTIFGSIAAAKRSGLPVVWTPTFHPGRPASYGASLPHVPMRAFDALAPRLAGHVDAVIALTAEEGAFFSRLGARRVQVIPHGVWEVDQRLEADVVGTFRRRHGIGDGPIVLVVGRNSPRHKGLGFCLQSFRALRSLMPTAVLVLVGGLGQGSPAVAGEPGVHVLGWLSDADRDAALSSAEVVFVPSVYEALSRAVIEGWAAAKPVVATDRVALASAIRQHGAGRVVAFGDAQAAGLALQRSILDRDWRTQVLSNACRLVAEEYLLPRLIDNVVELYDVVSLREATSQRTS